MDDLSPAQRARIGALVGGVGAAICVAIGAARLGLALLGGAGFQELRLQDAAILGAYVGGFVLAGAVLGTLAPARRTKAGSLLMGLIGAGTFFGAFGLAILADTSPRDRGSIVFSVTFCTFFFGALLAWHLYEPRPPAA